MASLPDLVSALARIDRRDRSAIDYAAREIREAGLIQTTKRGRGSANMTTLDAAHLLLGLYGGNGRGTAAEAARTLGSLPILGFFPPDHPLPLPLAIIDSQPTFAHAIASTIELGRRLAAQTPRTQGTMPVIGYLNEPPSLGMEVEGWPDGISVMVRINRPLLEPYINFAWIERDKIEEYTVIAKPAGPLGADGLKALAAHEEISLIHTLVFSTLHAALFPEG